MLIDLQEDSYTRIRKGQLPSKSETDESCGSVRTMTTYIIAQLIIVQGTKGKGGYSDKYGHRQPSNPYQALSTDSRAQSECHSNES